MKIIEYILYFMIFNLVLIMFTTLGIFSSLAWDVEQGDWFVEEQSLFDTILGSIGFGSIAAALATFSGAVVTGWLTRTSPFVYLSYGIMAGIFVSSWFSVFGIMDKIATTGGSADLTNTLFMVKAIILTVFAFLFLNGLRQMSTGGDRGAS